MKNWIFLFLVAVLWGCDKEDAPLQMEDEWAFTQEGVAVVEEQIEKGMAQLKEQMVKEGVKVDEVTSKVEDAFWHCGMHVNIYSDANSWSRSTTPLGVKYIWNEQLSDFESDYSTRAALEYLIPYDEQELDKNRLALLKSRKGNVINYRFLLDEEELYNEQLTIHKDGREEYYKYFGELVIHDKERKVGSLFPNVSFKKGEQVIYYSANEEEQGKLHQCFVTGNLKLKFTLNDYAQLLVLLPEVHDLELINELIASRCLNGKLLDVEKQVKLCDVKVLGIGYSGSIRVNCTFASGEEKELQLFDLSIDQPSLVSEMMNQRSLKTK